jgi:hypothetical protein
LVLIPVSCRACLTSSSSRTIVVRILFLVDKNIITQLCGSINFDAKEFLAT